MNTYPVLVEYQAARTAGISQALRFDPSGRPGAAAVRHEQELLQRRVAEHRRATEARLGGPISPRADRLNRSGCYNPEVGAAFYARARSAYNADAYRNHAHQRRQAFVDHWLREIALYREDLESGYPRALFGRTTAGCPNLAAADIHPLGNGWWYLKIEEVSWDNSRYSKAWHRAHGGAKSVDRRAVEFRRWSGKAGHSNIESRTAELTGWRGDWLARAVVDAGLAPEKPAAPLSIRLHAAYDAELVSSSHGYRIYRRTLVGAPIDWVVVAPLGTTYHSADRKALLRGLRNKIRRSTARIEGRLIDWAKCKALGFCDGGIRAFCNDFDLDPKGAYTPEEIEAAIRASAYRASQYMDELRTLAKAVGFRVAEFA